MSVCFICGNKDATKYQIEGVNFKDEVMSRIYLCDCCNSHLDNKHLADLLDWTSVKTIKIYNEIEELLSKEEMKINENLAKDILNFVNKQNCWNGVIIYFNGKAWKDTTTWNGERYTKIIKFPKRDKYGEYGGVYEFENKNPLTYFEYANPKTVSVSFDGPFFDYMNRYGDTNKIQKIFEKYNMYFEWGNSWNITGFKI